MLGHKVFVCSEQPQRVHLGKEAWTWEALTSLLCCLLVARMKKTGIKGDLRCYFRYTFYPKSMIRIWRLSTASVLVASTVLFRRGYGCLVSYNVPPYARAGLYKDTATGSHASSSQAYGVGSASPNWFDRWVIHWFSVHKPIVWRFQAYNFVFFFNILYSFVLHKI